MWISLRRRLLFGLQLVLGAGLPGGIGLVAVLLYWLLCGVVWHLLPIFDSPLWGVFFRIHLWLSSDQGKFTCVTVFYGGLFITLTAFSEHLESRRAQRRRAQAQATYLIDEESPQ